MKNENIENLVSLWKLIGETFHSYQSPCGFEVVNIDFSEWPNRIWSQQQSFKEKTNQWKEIMQSVNPAIVFSEWTDINERDNAEAYCMALKSVQIGVSLCLKEYKIQSMNNLIDIILVENSTDAKLWSNLFQQSFSYLIADRIIDRIKHEVSFYNLKYQDQFVGTVATYKHNHSIGIHSMGIIEPFRKRGFTEIVMQQILSNAKDEGLYCAHLQSSLMGLNIYKKLGFGEMFNMYNYKMK